jgi:hypothetical protein
MPPIFVDTDNSNPKAKIYDGSMAGQSADKAEAKMQSVVKAAVGSAAGFTTTKSKDAKGYVIRITITKIDKPGHETKCTLSGSIVRYPKEMTKSRGAGAQIVNTGTWGNTATASGTSENSLLDAVEAVAESMMKSGISGMSRDFLNR